MLIPVYKPYLNGNEKKYVNQCLDSSWISSKGEFIEKFEQEFAKYLNIPFATTVTNGTVALHLALVALGIGEGDEVIVPTFTYIASVNTIVQTGAKAIFADSLSSTWQLDPESVRTKITPRTRAVMAVHIYGHPCYMDALSKICKEHRIFLIEDCAEAFGSKYNDQFIGTFGDVSTFSFFGNKTITTGEGGMVVTPHASVYQRCCQLKNQGVADYKQYWHDVMAYNYRMTNICAAIGLAQLEQIDTIIEKKRKIAFAYNKQLASLPLSCHKEIGNIFHSYWMCSILLDDAELRNPLREHLAKQNIETRPFFYPAHTMPMHKKEFDLYPVAESIASRGINLPSWPDLSQEQINYICEQIKLFYRER